MTHLRRFLLYFFLTQNITFPFDSGMKYNPEKIHPQMQQCSKNDSNAPNLNSSRIIALHCNIRTEALAPRARAFFLILLHPPQKLIFKQWRDNHRKKQYFNLNQLLWFFLVTAAWRVRFSSVRRQTGVARAHRTRSGIQNRLELSALIFKVVLLDNPS